MQGSVDDVSRQVTALSFLLTGQHEAARETEDSAGHIEPITCVVDPEIRGIIPGELARVKGDDDQPKIEY